MRSITPIAVLVLAMFAGCENGAPWPPGHQETAAEPRRDFGPSAAYERRLVYLGPGPELPTAAVFDFSALTDSTGVRRALRARLFDGQGWTSLVDQSWRMERMRDPWRIVPHGDLSMIVGDAGELGALVHRGEPVVRLAPGSRLAEASPGAGTQLVLREAMLLAGDSTGSGLLLDAQVGRPTTGMTSSAPDDTSHARLAWPGTEALLVSNGYQVVLSTSPVGDIAWVRQEEYDRIHRGVGLHAGGAAPAGGSLPTGFRIGGPATTLTGELSVETATFDPSGGDPSGGDPSGGPSGDAVGGTPDVGYFLVSGWVEEGGVRRDVFGLVRHVW
ncbi:MAG: hypothetical protein ACOC3J_05525 [Gemmatimonadota bacterium]